LIASDQAESLWSKWLLLLGNELQERANIDAGRSRAVELQAASCNLQVASPKSRDNRLPLPDRGANVIRQIQFTAICMPRSFVKNDNCCCHVAMLRCCCCRCDVAAVILRLRPLPRLNCVFIRLATWFMAVAHLAPYRRTRICQQHTLTPATSNLQLATCSSSSSSSDFGGAWTPAAGSSFVLAIAGNEKLANMPRFALHRHAYVAHNWRLCHKRRNATCN